MDSKVSMTVEEYLHTSFDEADRDYVDGEVIERNMGELPHARLQGALISRLWALASTLGIQVAPEIRIQVAPTRFRVADVAVWRAGDIGRRIPTIPAFLVVEILSSEDRIVRLQPKVQEYLAYGVEYVWVIDPEERRALSYSPDNRGGSLVNELETHNPKIRLPLAELLAVLD